MLKEVNEAILWLQGPTTWNEWQGSVDADIPVAHGDGLVEKLSDDKLARDVDDLSAIFEELVEDVSLDNGGGLFERMPSSGGDEEWIAELEQDAQNVDEISKMFEDLSDEMAVDESSGVEDSLESDFSDEEDDVVNTSYSPASYVPAVPQWIPTAPVDPRSCIRTPVFQNLDSRIPRIPIPRIDMPFRTSEPSRHSSVSISPKRQKSMKPQYQHNPSTCWICKSNKSSDRKRALHRYVEKRHRRNWKKGPRYTGRSHVASARVRSGGRFICTAHWV